MGMRTLCSVCVTFVLVLLATVPAVFVWNLFRNGEGSVNWVVSVGAAVVLTGIMALAIVAKHAMEHSRSQ
jgi:hypothetical protein